MSNQIKWGIIGTGTIAKKFAADLKYVNGAVLTAVASRNQQTADAFASVFQIPKSYSSYKQLAMDDEIDVVYIATPHVFHFENTIMCLQNKKAVLCEKPFAINIKQVTAMIGAAREQNVFLMEGLWTKFLPHYKKVQDLIEQGTIGDVVAIQSNFGFTVTERSSARFTEISLGGGTLLDIGIYNIFLAMGILGKPDSVSSFIKKTSNGIDEQCAVTFGYNSGAIAQLFSTFNANIPIEAQVFGTKGNLKITHCFHDPSANILLSENSGTDYKIIEVEKAKGSGFEYEAAHVTDCLLKGIKESPVMSFQDSMDLIETLDTVRKITGIVYAED
jgi:predicted dehydrogenase